MVQKERVEVRSVKVCMRLLKLFFIRGRIFFYDTADF